MNNINLTTEQVVSLIKEVIKEELTRVSQVEKSVSENGKPHFTKKETADFFDVSVNCITDWSKKGILTPHHVGQRVYFSKEECFNVLFNNKQSDL